ncbi:hypothetical protein [Malikia spinosa]|uniref:hypothetical protein n=1 Tax=Malikia spinosa TaxID=86180 RepID=UPI0026A19912|nr:hypothetical protein [Malikia spinosa]
MNHTQGRSRVFYPLLLGALVALSCSTLQAQSRQELKEAQARFKQEMANCASGNTSQDKDSCMREARSALAEVRRGVPDRPGKLEADTRQRSEVHQGEPRDACEARLRGEGSATGSVEGGGVLREITRPAPAP